MTHAVVADALKLFISLWGLAAIVYIVRTNRWP